MPISYFVILIVLNLILYLSNNRIANYFKIYDQPDKIRKFHTKPVPITGGIIIYINIILFFLLQIFFFKEVVFFENIESLTIFFISCSFFFLLGFIDDKYFINANIKFLLSIIFITVILFFDQTLLISNVNFEFINFNLNFLSIPWTVLCFVLFINAFNMFDGFNLQSSSYAIFLLVVLFIGSNYSYFLIFPLFAMIIFSFLNYNYKSFLGDGGTYLVSFIASSLFIKLYNYGHIQFVDEIVCLMIIPGIDLMRLFVQRITIYKKSPFSPDRNHLHHYLLSQYSISKTFIYLNCLIIIPYLLGKIFSIFFIMICIQIIIYFFILSKLQKKN